MTNSAKRRNLIPQKDIRAILAKRFGKHQGYIECGDGWDWILKELHEKLVYLDRRYTILQVKEKFGTLRFYLGQGGRTKNVAIRLMHDAINRAEYLSSGTCELCGNSSVVADSERGIQYDQSVGLKFDQYGWYQTLCDTCAEPLGYRASKEDHE